MSTSQDYKLGARASYAYKLDVRVHLAVDMNVVRARCTTPHARFLRRTIWHNAYLEVDLARVRPRRTILARMRPRGTNFERACHMWTNLVRAYDRWTSLAHVSQADEFSVPRATLADKFNAPAPKRQTWRACLRLTDLDRAFFTWKSFTRARRRPTNLACAGRRHKKSARPKHLWGVNLMCPRLWLTD